VTKDLSISTKLRKETVVAQLGRLACHYPNSGHTSETIRVIAADWYNEFKNVPDEGFVAIIDKTIRTARFFPAIADLIANMETVGFCDNCIYRKLCDAEKKCRLKHGQNCDAYIKGAPQG